ncbi:MAG: hypothetical protein PHW47_06155 [Lachnospira sp.]|nr:hypothetical protein [Lachnospira sp.]
MAQSNWNYNVRFSHRNEDAVKAWENLHSKVVNENFKSQNEFVVRAINDYYERFQKEMNDPYLETREKEDAFADRIVEQVTQKVFANLPALAGMYLMQQQSMLAVGFQGGAVPINAGMNVSPSVNESKTDQQERNTENSSVQAQTDFTEEPEENDFLDFNL